ncbi:MAG: glutamate--tRNA ligase family protein [Oscillospiraceae bacterium]
MIAPHATDGVYVYDGRCRNRKPEEWAAFGRLPAWRVRVPDREVSLWDGVQGQYIENLARDCGDFVVRRADGVFVYQLAVVVDDAAAGVTEVVRGRDLLSSTPVKCTCRSFWALLSPAITMYPCSWRQTAAVCPNEMGIWTWRPCPATCLHRKSWGC